MNEESRRRKPVDSTIFKFGFEDDDSGSFLLLPDMELPFVEAATRYEVIEEIAHGGIGVVYKALDQELDRIVALKVLQKNHQGKPHFVHRFISESRIMASLQHPGIPHVYDIGTCPDGCPFYSMQLIDGSTLAELLEKKADRPSLSTLLGLFQMVCQAIAYAHSRGIIHLDLKPSNIMVGSFGEVHVMDWGMASTRREEGEIAKWLGSSLNSGQSPENREFDGPSHSIRGSLYYMSPEMARREPLGECSDIFGLGAILCELLTGSPPFSGETKKEIFLNVLGGDVREALGSLESTVADGRLIRIAKRCLATDPAERPQSAAELVAELARYREFALAELEGDMHRFFELSLDLFCIAGIDGYFRRINSNFTRVLGISEAELLARPFIEFVHPEDREKTVHQMSKLKSGQPVVRFRNRYKDSAGHYFEFEWTAKSIPSENLVFAVARNVT